MVALSSLQLNNEEETHQSLEILGLSIRFQKKWCLCALEGHPGWTSKKSWDHQIPFEKNCLENTWRPRPCLRSGAVWCRWKGGWHKHKCFQCSVVTSCFGVAALGCALAPGIATPRQELGESLSILLMLRARAILYYVANLVTLFPSEAVDRWAAPKKRNKTGTVATLWTRAERVSPSPASFLSKQIIALFPLFPRWLQRQWPGKPKIVR